MRYAGLLMTTIALLAGIGCTPAVEDEASVSLGAVPVAIVEAGSGFELTRGGEPYAIRGAGMPRDRLESFAAHGGNSIRNWDSTADYQDARELLDNAQANGVTVALGLPMIAERHGFDYDDEAAVAAQLERMRAEVLKYRDHPALLAWVIGNELNHEYENPRVYDAVNDVAKMIHDLDPHHPATTTLAGIKPEVVAMVTERAPALDFLSFQVYGDVFALPELVAAAGYDGPFMVTEWGTIGWWETDETTWGAGVEPTSSEKADVIRRAYREVLPELESGLIGNYVFFWGQKQERTPTWFGLLTEDGRETEAIDVLHREWNGEWPANRAPLVDRITIDGRGARDSVTLVPGEQYPIAFDVSDPDGDPIEYRWVLKPESTATQTGGDPEAEIPDLDGYIDDPRAGRTTLVAPPPGEYRLFAYARDGNNHAAHANVPFLVAAAPAAR